MKRIFLLIGAAMACCFGLSAQDAGQHTMTPEESTRMFVDHVAPKLNLTKGQKDSLTTIFMQYMDDIQKYHAENNAKVITFMMKARDEKVKNLLRDSLKFDKYLIVMEDIKKQASPRSSPQGGPPHGKQPGGDRDF
jgi:hypothetical protein